MVTENEESEKRPSPGMKFHTNRDGSVVEVSKCARIWDSASIGDSAIIAGNAMIGGNAIIEDSATIGGNAIIGDSAIIGGNAIIRGSASVRDSATIRGSISVRDSARIGGNAIIMGNVIIGGNASVWGNAHLRSHTHLAWVDKVGIGHQMTLHRTYSDGQWGWQINAGCETFNAPTVSDVCRLVKANIRGDVPEWEDADEDTRSLWRKQVKAALKYLASMVDETITDEDVASVQETEAVS